jgi:ABC-type transport system substrate-binding protein
MSASTPARREPLLRLAALACAVAALSLVLAAAGSSSIRSAAASGTTLTLTRISDNTPGFGPVRQDTGNDALVNSLIFSNLVKIAPNEKTILPDLATRWTMSANARVFTFYLRSGVTWSDGQPFTAADVVFTITQAAQFGATPYIGYTPTEWWQVQGATAIAGTTKPLSGVKAIGSSEVQITLAAPDASYVRGLTDAVYSILPQHLLSSATAKTIATLPFTTTSPVGTGPYTLTKDVANQYLEFTANPHYFGGVPKIQTIFFKLNVSDASAVAQLESGELDLALDLAPSDAAQLDKASGLVAKFYPSVAAEFLQFRTDNPQVSNYLVREAIFYAIDRRSMLKDLFNNEGTIMSTFPGFNQNAPGMNHYPYDPTKAKQLLAQAHFDFSKPLNLLYIPGAGGDPLWDQMVPVIQKYLKAVGINLVLDPLSPTAWTAALTSKTPDYAMSLNSGGATGLGPTHTSPFFNCKAPVDSYYANCTLTALFAKALTQSNIAQQNATYDQAALIINKYAPMPALWLNDNLDAYSSKLGGTFAIFSNDRDSLFGVSGWTLSS